MPVVVLAGMHGGCFVLFGHEHIRSVRDLRGKSVSIMYPGGGDQILLSSMLSYVGMNPKDVQWKPGTASLLDAMEMFANRQSDAFIGFAQQPAELRARKVGHVIIDTSVDRPWSQYFCCMLAANRDFVQRYPIATKRAVRAMLKAADFCAAEPLKVARFLSDNLYETRFQIGLEVMNNVAFDRWRNSDPADTLLFHALRLHEVGILKNHPKRILEQGTDWRFLNQIRRELKA